MRRLWLLLLVCLVLAGAVLVGGHAWVESQFRLAEGAFARRDSATVQKHLQPCLRFFSSRLSVQLLAARNARREGRFEDAEQHLRLCRPHGDEERVVLERILLRAVQGDSAHDSYLKERATQEDDEALLVLEVLIQRAINTRRLTAALQYLSRYLERRPNDLEARLGRAWVWEKRFSFADAVTDYRLAVEAHPDSEEARLRLAEALLVAGTPGEALEHFSHLRQAHPESPTLLFGEVRALQKLGRGDDALIPLKALLALEPQHAGALCERGVLLCQEGKAAEAEEWLRKSLKSNPHHRQAHYTLWQCLRALGRDQEEAEARQRLEAIDADLRRLDTVSRALVERPDDLGLQQEAGILFLRNGQEQEGVRWLESVLRQDPRHRSTHQALAEYHTRSGRPDRAAWHQRLADGL